MQSISAMAPPPKERLVETLAADKAAKTSKIAGPRVVIENLLAVPKGTFGILSHPLPVGRIDLLEPIFRVCCFLTNFTTAPLRKGGIAGESGEVAAGAADDGGADSDVVLVEDDDLAEW